MTTVTVGELETMKAVAEDVAVRLRSALDELHGAGITEAGAYGAKITSRLTLTAERLDACAVSFGRQIERAS